MPMPNATPRSSVKSSPASNNKHSNISPVHPSAKSSHASSPLRGHHHQAPPTINPPHIIAPVHKPQSELAQQAAPRSNFPYPGPAPRQPARVPDRNGPLAQQGVHRPSPIGHGPLPHTTIHRPGSGPIGVPRSPYRNSSAMPPQKRVSPFR